MAAIYISEGRRLRWGPSQAASLTERENQILKLVADGKDNGEISDYLGISKHTVKTHVANIFEKLGVNRRMEAVALVSSQLSGLNLASSQSPR